MDNPIAQPLQSLDESPFSVFRSGSTQAFVGREKIDCIAWDDHCNERFEDESRSGVFSASAKQDGFPVELVHDPVEGSTSGGEDGQLDAVGLTVFQEAVLLAHSPVYDRLHGVVESRLLSSLLFRHRLVGH